MSRFSPLLVTALAALAVAGCQSSVPAMDRRMDLPNAQTDRPMDRPMRSAGGASAEAIVVPEGYEVSVYAHGLTYPSGAAFGPDAALYVVDFGEIRFRPKGMVAKPGTGVIWRIARTR